MTETMTTYRGGCHCGRVRFEVKANLAKVYACNCSICAMEGWRLAFAQESDFTLTSGSDHLSDYQFGKKTIHHVFCKTCGIRSFGRGTNKEGATMYSVNVRCLDDVGVDADALQVESFDGRSL